MDAGLGQKGEVDVEGADVEDGGHDADQSALGQKLQTELEAGQLLVREAGPEVAEQEAAAEPAGVDGEIFDAGAEMKLDEKNFAIIYNDP